MNTNFIVPECPNCQSSLKQKQAKNGNTYYACPNWKPHGEGCVGFQWFPPKEDKKSVSNEATRSQATELLRELVSLGHEQQKTLELLKDDLEKLAKILERNEG